ncbi:MAG: hypothetical protein ABMA64_10750 [Myxococcota bacterium]
MAVDWCTLSPEQFEQAVNDLLMAEYGRLGRFVPYSTSHGKTDGGYDAAFDGPYRGRVGQWVVSVKQVRQAGKKAVSALRSLLDRDLARHPGRAWWVVTNVSVPPDDPIHGWLRDSAPGSEILAREELEQLLDKYRWVGRRYGLVSGYDVFCPAWRLENPGELPPSRRADLERLNALVRGAARCVAVVSPAGMGSRELAETFAHDAAVAPSRVVVWVNATEHEQLYGLEHSISDLVTEGPYLWVVPPSPVAHRVARLLAALNGDHQVVAFLAPLQAEARTGWARLELEPSTPEELREWVRQSQPRSREDIVSARVAWAGGRPDLVAVEPPTGLGTELVRRLREFVRDDRAMEEAAAWLVLLLPIAEVGGTEFDAAAHFSGLDAAQLRFVLDALCDERWVEASGDGWRETSPYLSADLVDALTRGARGDRIERELATLPDPLQWRAAVRLARFTDREGALLTAVDALATVVDAPEIGDATRAVRRAVDAAQISDKLGSRCAIVAGRAIRRLARGEHTRGFSIEVRHLVVQIGCWPAEVGLAVDLLLAHGVGDSFDLTAAGGELANPLGRHPERLIRLLDVIADRFDAHPDGVASLLVGVGERLLAARVPVVGSTSRSIRWSKVAWNEATGDVAQWRARVIALARRCVRHEIQTVRASGWKVLAGLWNWGGPAPDSVRALAEEVLLEVERALGSPVDWEDWRAAEHVAVRYVGVGLASNERMAKVIRAFRTDPAYQAWRLLGEPSWFFAEPDAVAETLVAGGGWLSVVHGQAKVHGTAPQIVAERVAAQVQSVGGVAEILDKVDPQQTGWPVRVVFLREWIRLRPDLFRPFLLGPEWAQIRAELRPLLILAALPAFGEELAQRLTGPVIGGRALGAALELAQLLRHPADVPDPDAARLVPVVMRVLPLANRAAALYTLAGHPGRETRQSVGDELADWVLFLSPKPDPRDAVAVIERLATLSDPSDPLLLPLVLRMNPWPDSGISPAPPELRGAVERALGWAIIDAVVAGARWPDEAAPFVSAAIRSDRARWERALAQVRGRSDVDFDALSPPIDFAHLQALVGWCRANGGATSWYLLLEQPCRGVDRGQLCGLVEEAVAADELDEAVLLFTFAPPQRGASDEVYLHTLSALVRTLDVEQEQQLVQALALELAGGARVRGDHAHALDEAAAWEAAAGKSGEGGDVLRRVARATRDIVRGLGDLRWTD